MKTKRNGRIELLRFLFALVILLHHTRFLFGYEQGILIGGSFAVEFFFLVSGYLLAGKIIGDGAFVHRSAHCTGDGAFAQGRSCVHGDGAFAQGRSCVHGNGPFVTQDGALMRGNGADARASAVRPVGRSDDNCESAGLGTETLQFLLHKIKGLCPQLPIAWFIGFFFISAVNGYGPRGILRFFRKSVWELLQVRMAGLYIAPNHVDGVVWYISTMLLCMAVLYPLLRRFPDMMTRVVCPLVAILLLGYLCQNFDSPRDPSKWLGVTFKGNLRGMAELCIGVCLYPLAEKIKRIPWNRFSAILAEVVMGVLFLDLLRYMTREPSNEDYFYLLLMAVLVMLAFSGVGALDGVLRNPLVYKLGQFSSALFFCHLYYARNLDAVLPEGLSRGQVLAVYLFCAFGTALVTEGLSALWNRSRQSRRKLTGRIFLK